MDNHVHVEIETGDAVYFMYKEIGSNRDAAYLDDVAFNLFSTLVSRIKRVNVIMGKIDGNESK